jgi:hypothetical protein
VAGKLVTTHHTYDRQGMSYKECVPSYNYGSEPNSIALLVCNKLECDLLGFIYITGTKREKNKVASSVCTYREKERT